MTLQTLGNFISFAATFVGLLTAIVGFFAASYTLITNYANRNAKIVLSSDSASLSFVEIRRQPLAENVWKKGKNISSYPLINFIRYLLRSLALLIPSVILILIGIASGTIDLYSIPIIGFLIHDPSKIAIIVGITIISYTIVFINYFSNLSKLGTSPEDARFFLFQDADIIVEADYGYLFYRCQEVLKIMRIDAIELDADAFFLEGKFSHRWGSVRRMTVQLKLIKNNRYSIHLDFTPPYSSTSVRSARKKCKTINLFIDELMGKIETKQKKQQNSSS